MGDIDAMEQFIIGVLWSLFATWSGEVEITVRIMVSVNLGHYHADKGATSQAEKNKSILVGDRSLIIWNRHGGSSPEYAAHDS